MLIEFERCTDSNRKPALVIRLKTEKQQVVGEQLLSPPPDWWNPDCQDSVVWIRFHAGHPRQP